jgi:hypothetical protein
MVNANIRTSKYLAAITGGFFVAVSPWTLCTLIIVAAKIKLQEDVDYFVTWLALSNSFWNCLIYGLMNRKFRRAAMRFTCGRWIKSLRETVQSRSVDESRDTSAESTAYSQYKRRTAKKKKMADHQNGETPMTSPSNTFIDESGNTPRGTPDGSPRASPQIMPKRITDLVNETRNL